MSRCSSFAPAAARQIRREEEEDGGGCFVGAGRATRELIDTEAEADSSRLFFTLTRYVSQPKLRITHFIYSPMNNTNVGREIFPRFTDLNAFN